MFTAQLAEIRKITLAKLICKTLDRVETIQKFVMLQPLRIALRGLGYVLHTTHRLLSSYNGTTFTYFSWVIIIASI